MKPEELIAKLKIKYLGRKHIDLTLTRSRRRGIASGSGSGSGGENGDTDATGSSSIDNEDSIDDDDMLQRFDWKALGKDVSKFFRRTPTISFM